MGRRMHEVVSDIGSFLLENVSVSVAIVMSHVNAIPGRSCRPIRCQIRCSMFGSPISMACIDSVPAIGKTNHENNSA